MQAGWQTFTTTRLQNLKEEEEELLHRLSTGLIAFFAIASGKWIRSPARAQGVMEMCGDMFQQYAVRATMTAITTELMECAQGWC